MAPAAAPAYDLRCSLLEEGRLPPPAPPRLVPKPKKTNPPWVRAIRASGNTACLAVIVFILVVMVRSRDKDRYLFLNCAVVVLLSLGIPAMAYTSTMGVDEVDQR